uniref:Uncharacterized protein n=1 Tax=viral metagenome TaxID=1070528 RepID=A0A6M3M145_9ZZZZ
MAKELRKRVFEKEAELTVSRTVLKQTQPLKTKRMKIRPFVTQPAMVTVKYGVTVGLPNFGSARADIQLTVPCYKEEMLEVYKETREIVDKLIEKEAVRFGEKAEE